MKVNLLEDTEVIKDLEKQIDQLSLLCQRLLERVMDLEVRVENIALEVRGLALQPSAKNLQMDRDDVADLDTK